MSLSTAISTITCAHISPILPFVQIRFEISAQCALLHLHYIYSILNRYTVVNRNVNRNFRQHEYRFYASSRKFRRGLWNRNIYESHQPLQIVNTFYWFLDFERFTTMYFFLSMYTIYSDRRSNVRVLWYRGLLQKIRSIVGIHYIGNFWIFHVVFRNVTENLGNNSKNYGK